MAFQDRSKQSVSSLLALLRETQDGDGPSGSGDGVGADYIQRPPAAHISRSVPAAGSSSASTQPGHQRPPASSSSSSSGGLGFGRQHAASSSAAGGGAGSSSRSAGSSGLPSSSQLSSLLAQLSDHPGVGVGESSKSATSTSASHSAFDGRRGQVETFGPVGQTPGSSRAWEPAGVRRTSRDGTGGGSGGTDSRRLSGDVDMVARRTSSFSETPDKGKRKADDLDSDRATWSFTRCLPVITDLLRDDQFVGELKKMKVDQDALERRLWARMEKVKAEAAKRTEPERQIAKITRKPIPADKQAKWAQDLKKELDTFFRTQVVPAVDGLASRQRARLEHLGVPGLGGGPGDAVDVERRKEDRARDKARIKRIMDVLDGAIADA